MSEQENQYETDLWGNRVFVHKGKRGRPPFERTPENANKVSMLLSLGWSNGRISGCILDPRTGKSISEPTLKRYFRSELSARDLARDRLEARRFEAVTAQAFAGNVGALRLLNQMIEKNDLMKMAARLNDVGASAPKEKLGKKVQARRTAQELVDGTKSSEWGDDIKPGYH